MQWEVAKASTFAQRIEECPKNFNQGQKYRREGYLCQKIPFEVTSVRNNLWNLCKIFSRISTRVTDFDVMSTEKEEYQCQEMPLEVTVVRHTFEDWKFFVDWLGEDEQDEGCVFLASPGGKYYSQRFFQGYSSDSQSRGQF